MFHHQSLIESFQRSRFKSFLRPKTYRHQLTHLYWYLQYEISNIYNILQQFSIMNLSKLKVVLSKLDTKYRAFFLSKKIKIQSY